MSDQTIDLTVGPSQVVDIVLGISSIIDLNLDILSSTGFNELSLVGLDLYPAKPIDLTVAEVAVGVPGPKGDPGLSGSVAPPIIHHQLVSLASWVIIHNLGYWPNVTVYTIDGEIMIPDIVHGSINSFTIIHANPQIGIVAYR